jgi:hypothetical protein
MRHQDPATALSAPEGAGEPQGPEGSGEPQGGAPVGRAPVGRGDAGPAGFLVLAALALAAAAWTWLALPHERELRSLWVLLAKLVPFVLATEAIAAFQPAWLRRLPLARLAIPAAFLVYFCFFVPKIFFNSGDATFEQLYDLMLTLTPFLILALVLAYRLGGGAAATVRRLAYAMLLLMLSGLEDLAYILVNPHTDPAWQQIPEVWTWAHHMTVFVGHPLTRNQAFGFIAVHVVLALLVLFLPATAVRRPLARLGRRRSATRAADRPTAGA